MLLAAGMEHHRGTNGKVNVFFKSGEICLVVSSHFAIRHGLVHLECTIAAIDCEFERSFGCEPFEPCALETFSTYYANFDEFYEHSWINPQSASLQLRAAATPYLNLLARYPNNRNAMAAELRTGFFAGLPAKKFFSSPAKVAAFRAWLGVSDPGGNDADTQVRR
jgi:hypothetical protein